MEKWARMHWNGRVKGVWVGHWQHLPDFQFPISSPDFSIFPNSYIQLVTWTSITGPAYRISRLPLSLLPPPVSPWLQRLASSSTQHCKWVTYQSFVICLLVAKSNWTNFLHTSYSFLPSHWLRSYFFSLSLNYCNNCVSVSVLLALTYHVITLLKILSRASPLPKVKILSL